MTQFFPISPAHRLPSDGRISVSNRTPLSMTSLLRSPHWFSDILVSGWQMVFQGTYGSRVVLQCLYKEELIPPPTGINPQGWGFGFPLLSILSIWTQLSQPQNYFQLRVPSTSSTLVNTSSKSKSSSPLFLVCGHFENRSRFPLYSTVV